ncbi:MAG: hypothetical protein A2020_00230 [Lentisphaerae bacterium GWF2_45_14]|nr:MAG: hypothetical protein A2020_00230 [Lentisphaerae bacterium GWF2_45_14]
MKKFISIKEEILSEIKSGKLKSLDKLPVRETLIRKYGVTRATLNKAIGELIKEGWLKAVRSQGTFVSSGPDKIRMALVCDFSLQEKTVNAPKFAHMVDALNYILVSSFDGKFDFIDSLKASKDMSFISSYDIVVWIIPDDATLAKIQEYKHKVLIINRYGTALNYVSTNHRKAVSNITEHFIAKFSGTVNLFYLDMDQDDFIARERRAGFMDACRSHDLFYSFCRISRVFQENVDNLMATRFDAEKANVIVSPTASVTGAVLRMAYLRKLQMGKDFYYSDFDNANSVENTGIAIPSVLQDYAAMGREAASAMKNVIQGPVQLYVPHRLINI